MHSEHRPILLFLELFKIQTKQNEHVEKVLWQAFHGNPLLYLQTHLMALHFFCD